MAAQLHYVVFGKIGVKQSTDAGFPHGVVWQLYFSWLKTSSRNRVRQKLAQLIFTQWRTHIPDQVISSSFLLHCQVKWSLWFLHFIRPVFLERFVEFHRASGITCSEELRRESRLWPVSLLPCLVFDTLSVGQTRSSRPVSGSFSSSTSPQHSFLDSSLARKPNATKETTKGFFAGPGDRGHRTAWSRRAFLVLLLLIPGQRLVCCRNHFERGSFVLRRGPDGCGKTPHLQRYWKVTSSQKSSAGSFFEMTWVNSVRTLLHFLF